VAGLPFPPSFQLFLPHENNAPIKSRNKYKNQSRTRERVNLTSDNKKNMAR